jgi:poly(ADP-ribose) glycohydrolase ARH3
VRGEGFDRRLGALLGTFVGDALGMPFEGAPPRSAPEPLELLPARLGRGTYTDDTEMMIALAEVLADAGECEEERLAARFLEGHNPARGYGAGTLTVFSLWREGVPVTAAAGRTFAGGSYGNGAAMRVAPVGAYFADDEERLVLEAARSARITHAHPLGVAGAVAQAAAVGAAVRQGDPLATAIRTSDEPALREALDRAAAAVLADVAPEDVADVLGAGVSALESVPAALCAAERAESFEEACTYAVQIGGDADTIAAMAGAVAGARFGASAIPRRWLDGLEDNERGRTYVEALAERLWGEKGAVTP